MLAVTLVKADRQRFRILLVLAVMTVLLGTSCRPIDQALTTSTPTNIQVTRAQPTNTNAPQPSLTSTPNITQVALTVLTNTPLPTTQPDLQPTLSPTAFPTIDSPSSTPVTVTDTPQPRPSSTPVPQTPTGTATSLPTFTPTSSPVPPPTATTRPTLPSQEGGEWDMEAGFTPGSSPVGGVCPGWAVAVGWNAFLAPGVPASSCFNENKNLANVYSGERSQEITFDFIKAEAGIYRKARTIPGHSYRIEAWGKHVRSESPVQLSLGVDLTGGENWQATSVKWYPWDQTGEDIWVNTQVTVQANGETLTVFIKGYHPFAVQGGATLLDNIRVVDLTQTTR